MSDDRLSTRLLAVRRRRLLESVATKLSKLQEYVQKVVRAGVNRRGAIRRREANVRVRANPRLMARVNARRNWRRVRPVVLGLGAWNREERLEENKVRNAKRLAEYKAAGGIFKRMKE